MRDPHVDRLHYDIGTGDGISFGAPPRLVIRNHIGNFALHAGQLVVEPADHYATEAEARAVVDPFLRSWEIRADLTQNLGSIRFKYVRSELHDRNPPPPGSGVTIHAEAALMVMVAGEASVHLTQNRYPESPQGFRTTPEVEMAYGRWRAFREHREPLQSMAYFVLTVAESVAGSRDQASQSFAIDRPVLDTIGRLTSTKGDNTSARKVNRQMLFDPLSGPESAWLEAAVKRLILRLGEHAAGAPFPQLSLGDLPRL